MPDLWYGVLDQLELSRPASPVLQQREVIERSEGVMDKIMEIAEQTSDLVVERVEKAMIRYPGQSLESVFNEIVRISPKLGVESAKLARMKLGIV